jgi:hypothetical protein
MKKSLLFLLALVISLGTMAQVKPIFSAQKDIKKVLRPTYRDDGSVKGQSTPNVLVSNKATIEDPTLMQTKYDLQSNCNSPRHIYAFPDGTIGATITWSALEDGAYADRGTGYNYFDGTAWGSMPTARIESMRTGWPNYQPFGTDGEIVVSHQSATTNLVMSTRPTKGTGAWTNALIGSPAGAAGMLWPRMITSGPDHTTIHIIALTSPTANGGTVYNGMDGALLYNRSTDGGATWDGWQQLAGMTSSEYINISADSYEWANAKGDTIAFVYGDSFRDFAIMKSVDNGNSWSQTIIWPCPYNLWAGGDTTGTFWCPDSYVTANIDNNGIVHVLTGLQRGSGDAAGLTYWVPRTDGLLYWNETMPTWPEVLDPYELEAGGNVIGWCLDTALFNVDSVPDAELAYYYNSMSSFPTMTIDNEGNIYAFWSSIRNLKDPDNYRLRHLYRRSWSALAGAWSPDFTNLTGDFLYTWSECVYATASPTATTDKVHIVFQMDDYAGVKFKGDNGAQGQTAYTTNNLVYLSTPTYVGIDEPKAKLNFAVTQNYPNPAQGATEVKVVLSKPGNLSMQVSSLVGQKMMEVSKGNVGAGNHLFTIDCSNLPSGVYFYTVKVGNESSTRKMIVQ